MQGNNKPRKQVVTVTHQQRFSTLAQQALDPLSVLTNELPVVYATRSRQARRIKGAMRQITRFSALIQATEKAATQAA